jgi:hypothetical protein
MWTRCTNPRRKNFAHYGGRGITVCDRWQSFENFLADMGERPPGTSLDRINGDGNYEPGNCRWSTRVEQMSNVRRNHLLTVGGETLTVTAWSRRTGIGVATITQRIRLGWAPERVVGTPPDTRRQPRERRVQPSGAVVAVEE